MITFVTGVSLCHARTSVQYFHEEARHTQIVGERRSADEMVEELMTGATQNKCEYCGKASEDVKKRYDRALLYEFRIEITSLLCNECDAKSVTESYTRYVDVTFDAKTGMVIGKRIGPYESFEDFAIDIGIFAAYLAMGLDFKATKLFMRLTDFRPSGAAMWAGDRRVANISDKEKNEILIATRSILNNNRSRLTKFGLPNDVIEALIGGN